MSVLAKLRLRKIFFPGKASDDFQNSGTSFFRNISLLETVQSVARENFREQKIKIWNLGSSIGAETYSYASYFQELKDEKAIDDYKIIASDNIFTNLAHIHRNQYPNHLMPTDERIRGFSGKYFSSNGKNISFDQRIYRQIETKTYNFNEPAPIFGAESFDDRDFDFIIFNFSISYAIPTESHIENLLRSVISRLSARGTLIANFFHIPWMETHQFDIFHRTCEKVLKSEKIFPLKNNCWEILSEDVSRTIARETFVRYFLDHWNLSGQPFTYPSSLFTRNAAAETSSGIFADALKDSSDTALKKNYLKSLQRNLFLYPALIEILNRPETSISEKRNLIHQTLRKVDQAYRIDIQKIVLENPIRRSELHLERNILWKLREGVDSMLNYLSKNFEKFLEDKNLLKEFSIVFLRIQFESGNYYSCWNFIRENEEALIENPEIYPYIIQTLFRLGLFESLYAFVKNAKLDASVKKYNLMTCRALLGKLMDEDRRTLKFPEGFSMPKKQLALYFLKMRTAGTDLSLLVPPEHNTGW